MKNTVSLFRRGLLRATTAGLLLGLAAPLALHAQAVWNPVDDRNDYEGDPNSYEPFWSYGYVAPDQNGNNGHAGNWSGNLSPGSAGGPVDVILGAPGGTLCDVTVTLNSLAIQPGGTLSFYKGQTLTVANTTFATDGVMGGGSTYTNTGTLFKSAGTGTYAFDGSTVFNSTPGTTVAVNSGVLQLGGGGGLLDTVTFLPAAGTAIVLVTPDTASNTYDAHFQGTLSNGAGTGTVLLGGGTMSGGSQPCTLAFTGSVFQWTGGVIGSYQQGAVFTNTGVVNLSGDAAKETYAVFTNQNLVTQSGAGQFNVGYYNSGGSFTNAAGATYDLQSDAPIGQSGYPFNNAGLFKKSGGTGTSILSVKFNNQGGTVEVDSGTLQFPLNQTSTSTGGVFNVAAGALLDLGDGEHFTGTYTGSGAGTVQLSTGTDPNNLYSDNVTGMILNFPGSLFQWTGGTIGSYQGGNLVTNTGTINLSGGDTKTTLAVFTNAATMIQAGAGAFNIGVNNSGGSFTNAAGATYDLQSDANVGQSGYAFNNVGLFKKSGGTGTSTLSVAFNNQGGTVEVDSGTLQFPLNTGGNLSTGGTFDVAAGAVLDLGDSQKFVGTFTGSGAGVVQLSTGTDPNNLYSDNQTGVTFNFPGSLFQWTGGTIGSYQGGHLVSNVGTLNLSGDNDKTTLAVFTNTGTMIQSGAGNLNIGSANSGGSLTNAPTGTYDLQSDAAIGQSGYNFYNKGFFQKSAGTGTSKMTCALTNTGTISVYSGTVEFANTVNDVANNTLTEGTWNVYNGATLTFDNAGTINTNQADVFLRGPNSVFAAFNSLSDNQGTFALLALRQFLTAGALSNEGDLALDAGTTLHVAGAFTASGTNSELAFTVGGTATSGATSPGILQVDGAAAVAGNLSVAFSAGAALPAYTDALTVVSTSAPVTGSFANAANGARVNTADGKGSFRVSYGAGAASPDAVTLDQFVVMGGTAPSSLPVITLSALQPNAYANQGIIGTLQLTRSGDQSQTLHVNLQIKGTGVDGTDYALLKTSKKFNPGKTTKPIKIVPTDESYYAGGKKTVKITVLPGDGYTVGGATHRQGQDLLRPLNRKITARGNGGGAGVGAVWLAPAFFWPAAPLTRPGISSVRLVRVCARPCRDRAATPGHPAA